MGTLSSYLKPVLDMRQQPTRITLTGLGSDAQFLALPSAVPDTSRITAIRVNTPEPVFAVRKRDLSGSTPDDVFTLQRRHDSLRADLERSAAELERATVSLVRNYDSLAEAAEFERYPTGTGLGLSSTGYFPAAASSSSTSLQRLQPYN